MTHATPQADRYYLSLLPGLEDLAAAELAELLPAAGLERLGPGRLFVRYGGPPAALTGLRTIENVFAYVGERGGLGPGRAELNTLRDWLRSLPLQAARSRWESLHGGLAQPRFRVTAQRQGSHEYQSPQIAAAAGAGIQAATGWTVDLEGFELEFVVTVEGDRGLVGLRLTPTALHRRSRVRHGLASLNPTLAYAMVMLSVPRAEETVLDPMCGSGTLLIERAAAGPVRLVGSDAFAAPLQEARVNLDAVGLRASLLQADARRLPLRAGSVDRVLCNLPWGRRVLSSRAVRGLYFRALPEMARVLRPGGCAVLLTLQRRLLEQVLVENPALTAEHHRVVCVGGLKPHLYVLRRD